jgi:HlyD family secretion protein
MPLVILPETTAELQSREKLRLGQSATIRLSALSQRITPELDGTVERIAAEASRDEKTGAEYYPVRVTLAPEQLARLGGIRLTASMPVEIFARTRERTLLSYLVKPLADQLARAMRHG